MTSSLSRAAVVGLSLLGLVGCGGEVATLEYVSITPELPKLGEVATVQFQLTDYRGLPLAGQNVTFSLDQDRPGVKLGPLSGTSLKGSGVIETQLIVSSRVTSVRVIAKAGDKTVSSPPLSFAGSDASGRQLTFQCGNIAGDGSGGVHAIGAYDETRYLIAGVKVQCVAHVADRNGDGVASALVSFMTEAGTIGPNETTLADVIGNAEILYKTSLPLPKEVPPGVFVWNPNNDKFHTGEFLAPLWMHPFRWTTNPIATLDTGLPAVNPANLQEPRRPDPIRRQPGNGQAFQNNPRDNLVTMIAVTSGEEGFTDQNNNGVHDNDNGMGQPEPFDDLTEPFVDADDNGTWDPDERFIDANGNGKWDEKNEKWDQNTLIWVQERITWTGMPHGEDAKLMSAVNPAPSVRGVAGAGGLPITVGCRETVPVDLIVSDPWFNSLARNGGGDGCEGESTDVVETVGGVTGLAFTYPAADVINFSIKDALDRKPQPMTSPPQPGCFPPPGGVCSPAGPDCYTFGIPIICKFTASPLEGHVVFLSTGVRGRIHKNLP